QHLTLGATGLGEQLLDGSDDDVLHVSGAGRAVRGVPAGPAEDTALGVDQPCGHLGAADVHPDREPLVVLRAAGRGPGVPLDGRPLARRAAARSAAPIIPASLPRRAGTSEAIGRWPRPVSCLANAARAGSSRRSPAAATPPPITTIAGSSTAARLAS